MNYKNNFVKIIIMNKKDILFDNFILWNQVSKKDKYKIIIKYFKFYDFDMDIDVCLYILNNFMKPDLRYINNNKNLKLSNFPVYFGCEKIFEKVMLSERTRCNGCRVRTGILDDSDIIERNQDYYNVCQCGKNYCYECFQEFFIINNSVDKIKCRGCSNINYVKDIDKFKSGIFPYNLFKLNFQITLLKKSLSINFYVNNPKYMYGKINCYSIKLLLTDSYFFRKNLTIKDIQLKIIRLYNYHFKHKYKKIIVFSKFYHFINEILKIQYDSKDLIKKYNEIYKNPKKMLEVFIVLSSINKYS